MNWKTGKVKFSATGRYGVHPMDEDDVYTVKEFKEFCESGAFIDYDGEGAPVKDGYADLKVIVKPSKLDLIPEDATHIVWFNR